MFTKNIKLQSSRILLKKLTHKDATEKYCSWLNDKDTTKYLSTHEATIDSIKKYIEEKNSCDQCLFLGIFTENKHIGNVKLELIKNNMAEMGIMIGDKNYWGKGIATEVTNMVCNYASKFVNEITLHVAPKNKTAIRVYEKNGFEIIGYTMSKKTCKKICVSCPHNNCKNTCA
jgi:[ribosomal protein S5]-alanine N-acetyltransferase